MNQLVSGLPQIVLLLTSVAAFSVYGVLLLVLFALSWSVRLYLWRKSVKRAEPVPQTPAISGETVPVPLPLPATPYPPMFVRYFWVIQGVLIILTVAVGLPYFFVPSSKITVPPLPLFEPLHVTRDSPLTVAFDRPVSSHFTASVAPAVEGNWQAEAYGIFPWFTGKLRFIPKHSFTPDTEYQVSLSFGSRFAPSVLSKAGQYLFLFKTPPAPSVADILPKDQGINVPTDAAIEIVTTPYEAGSAKWSFEISPQTAFTSDVRDGESRITVKPVRKFDQGTTYTLSVYVTPKTLDYETGEVKETLEKKLVKQTRFTTVESASVSKVTPSGNSVLPHEPLTIVFKQPMDVKSVEEALSISPATQGTFSWKKDDELVFTPTGTWNRNTPYVVSVGRSAKTKAGGTLDNDYIHSFTTVGEVLVTGMNPSANAQNVPVTGGITITFNQPVIESEAEKKINIVPQTSGSFRWQGNTVSFTPEKAFLYGTTYTVSVGKGIKSKYGFDSAESTSYRFTTASDTFALNIPLYKQNYHFTCYSNAAKMALAYRGVTVEELGFLNEIGFDKTPRNFVTNTWGNPNSGIVGTYDGSSPGGYGVHWDPVAKAMSKYRRVEVKRNWNIPDLLESVRQGNPVMVWWVNGLWPATPATWNLPQGGTVYTVNGMHVEVVKGWIGDQKNPSYILTNDPFRGDRRYTQDRFLDLWRWFENTAIIVY